MAAKIKSQPNNRATPIENVRGSTIAQTPHINTITAEANNHRAARFTSTSMLPGSDELLTKSGRILALTIAIEQDFPVLDLGGQCSDWPQALQEMGSN